MDFGLCGGYLLDNWDTLLSVKSSGIGHSGVLQHSAEVVT